RGIGYDEQVRLQNRMGANRTIDWGLTHAQSDLCFEPLTALVYQIDYSDRRAADGGCDLNHLVEIGLPWRVEDAVIPKGTKTILFGAMQLRFHRPSLVFVEMSDTVHF